MVKKILTILTSALMVLATISGGVSSLAATPVLAEGETSDLVITVPGGEDDVYYYLSIMASAGAMNGSQFAGKTFSITDGQTTTTFTMPSDKQGADVYIPLKKGETLTIEDVTGYAVAPYIPSGAPYYGEFNGFAVSIYPFYVNGQHFWNDVYHFSPSNAGYPSELIQRWNTALASYPVLGSTEDDISFFDQYDGSDPVSYPWIAYSEYASSFSFAFTDNYQLTDQDTVWNRTTDAQNQMSFHISHSVDDSQTYNNLQNVYIDSGSGLISQGTDYTKDHGSVIINLEPSYLEGLSDGEHTFVATFSGAKRVQTTFNVQGNSTPAFTQYTAVAGDNDIPLNKYLVLAEDAQVPTATFNFAVSNGTGIPASTGVQEVLAPTAANGVGGSAPTIASISYTAADTASMTDAADAGVTLSAGQKYVKKTTYVDFSSTTFTEPGIYRYVITESGANGVEAIFNMDAQKGQGATAKQRILDVYVTDANDGTNTLSISEYVLHELADNVPTGSNNGTGYASLPIADKSVGYVNVFLSQNLAVANKTDGNQGSRDKYFAYTVALTGLQGEKAYDVDISNADAEVASTVATAQGYRGNSNPTTLTSLANGSASGTFYLRDDQNIEIKGLPVGVGYTVTAVAEDYKQTAGATITAGTFTDSTTGTIASADINTGYTHTRNGVIPTGIAVSAAGTIAIAGMAMAGLLAKRKREDEE